MKRELQRLRVLLQRAQRGLAIGLKALADAEEIGNNLLRRESVVSYKEPHAPDPTLTFQRPLIDQGAMMVTWGVHKCPLRSRILLALVDSLARRPDRFVPFEQLRHEVWEGAQRSDDTIRSTVRRLKAELIRANMGELARRICAVGSRYGLITNPR